MPISQSALLLLSPGPPGLPGDSSSLIFPGLDSLVSPKKDAICTKLSSRALLQSLTAELDAKAGGSKCFCPFEEPPAIKYRQ